MFCQNFTDYSRLVAALKTQSSPFIFYKTLFDNILYIKSLQPDTLNRKKGTTF